jgi:hypothetical protein
MVAERSLDMPLIPRSQRTAEESIRHLTDLAQPYVPEPVVAVGMLQPAGTWGNYGISKVSPALAAIVRHRHNKAAGGLARTGSMRRPQMALLALTETRVYALAVTFKSGGWAVGDAIGTWDRSDLRVETTPGRMATKVEIDVISTGEHYVLEATTTGDDGFTGTFLQALTGRA